MAAIESTSRQQFEVAKTASGATIQVTIGEPSLKRTELGLSTWGASTVLANRLHKFPEHALPKNRPAHPQSKHDVYHFDVLELGAGTGLVGLSAAMIWQAHVMLTDLPKVVPNLLSNIALNATQINAAGGSVLTGTLDWASPDQLLLSDSSCITAVSERKARVIIAADIVYSEEQPPMFVNVVTTWLERSKAARMMLAYPLRIGCLDHVRDLWQRLEASGLQAIDEGREEVGPEWDDEKLQEWCVWQWRDP